MRKSNKFADENITDTKGMRRFKNYKRLTKDRVDYSDEPFRPKGTKMKNGMKKVAKAEVKGHEKRMHGMKCGGKVMKYAEGGKVEKPMPKGKEMVPDFAKDKNQDMKNKKAAENYAKTRKFAKGGGIESRGKTKGRFV